MIDIKHARLAFKTFLEKYSDKKVLGFELKVSHTYHVVENAKTIAKKLCLSEEDINLAELIGLLHDIGRFEELEVLKGFDSVKFDHASHGVKMLFEDNLIRDFIKDDSYDEIIKFAINNHSRLKIEGETDDRSLLHSKIIRDADKLDNFRVKKEEQIEAIFPGKVKNKEEFESSLISDKVLECVKEYKCVDIRDRVTALDYWVCILAFIFDLNFKETYQLVKEKNYVNVLIDRFTYKILKTDHTMNEIRDILNNFVDSKIK